MSKMLGITIRTARTMRGLKQSELAERLGVTRAAVGLWETGQNEPSTQHFIDLCSILEIDVAAASGGKVKHIENGIDDGDLPAFRDIRTEPPVQIREIGDRLCVIGASAIYDRADFAIDHIFGLTDHIIDTVPRPPGISIIKKAYCFYVAHATLSPRYEPGDLLYVDRSREPQVGDYVVVRLSQVYEKVLRTAFLGKLVYRDASGLKLQEHTPEKEVSISATDFKYVDRVFPWRELLGN